MIRAMIGQPQEIAIGPPTVPRLPVDREAAGQHRDDRERDREVGEAATSRGSAPACSRARPGAARPGRCCRRASDIRIPLESGPWWLPPPTSRAKRSDQPAFWIAGTLRCRTATKSRHYGRVVAPSQTGRLGSPRGRRGRGDRRGCGRRRRGADARSARRPRDRSRGGGGAGPRRQRHQLGHPPHRVRLDARRARDPPDPSFGRASRRRCWTHSRSGPALRRNPAAGRRGRALDDGPAGRAGRSATASPCASPPTARFGFRASP